MVRACSTAFGPIPVGAGPGAAAAVVAGQLAHLLDGGLDVAEELIPLDDLAGVVGGVAGVGIQLDEQAIGLDGALVAGLVEDGVGQLLQDLARVLLAADLGQELEGVAGGLGVVLREQLDEVVERLALKLLGALLLLLAAAGLLLGQIEHVLEPQRRLGRVAQLPVAPGGLEQRQVVERRLGVLEDLLVGLERGLVVLLLVEPVLGDRHPGVGDVAGARVLIEDDLEVLDRLAELPLVAQREGIEVDDRVDLAELRVLVDELQVGRLRARQIDGRRAVRDLRALGAIGVAGRHGGLIAAHLLEVDLLRLLPVELGQLVEGLGLLLGAEAGRAARVLAQVGLDEADRLAPGVGDLRFLLFQRLLQDRRQRLFGLARLVVVALVRLAALVGRRRNAVAPDAASDERADDGEGSTPRPGGAAASYL